METAHTLTQTLSVLVGQLQSPDSTATEVRDTLRLLVAQARDRGVLLQFDGGRLVVDGEPIPAGVTACGALISRLQAHGIRRLTIRQLASAPELLKVARLLIEAPSRSAEEFEQRVAPLKLWHVVISQSDAPERGPADAAAGVPERFGLGRTLDRVRNANGSEDARAALDELCAMAEGLVEEGRAESVAAILVGVVKVEREVGGTAALRVPCARAVDRLSKPAVTRLVAQLIPSLVGRPAAYREHLEALGRCGTPGAAALIAHLMAADTIEERRVFFDAIVQLGAGVSMLIDALGHPQWFVVRNAACLLGEMEAEEADSALARLLEHRDERVREAAAAALARIDTSTSRAALQRMIRDRSPQVRLHAAAAFANNPSMVKVATPLATALDTETDADVQLSIIAALGRLGTPDAVQKLMRAALPSAGRQRPASFRIAALESLTLARGPAALPTLRSLLADEEVAVRESAKRLIAATALSA